MSRTPPLSTVLLPAGTPVHTRSSTTDRFAPKYEDRDTTFRRLSDEMASFFVGPMPPHDFLDTFLPSTSLSPVLPFERGMFSRVRETASEAEMYDTFVEIVGSRLPKLALVNTSRKKDKAPYTRFTFSCQPDYSVYSSGSDHNSEFNSALVEFPIEFKTTTDQDPFVADPPILPKSLAIENPFMSTSYSGCQVAGQITAYATLVLSAQYRTHTFLVLIFKKYARLIRWDRSGAVVTAPIYYDNEPHLLDFFIRYNHADPETRGHDPTVGPPTEDEVRNARTLSDLASAKSLLAVSIADPLHPQQSSRYVICAPFSRPDIPAGRWTRTSIAYDVRRRKRVLLKDSWRVLLDDVTPEGEIYARLRQHSVPNIPSCSRAGDVGDDTYHKSRTHEFVGKYGGPMQLTPHRHYRLVLDTIGRRLESFSRSWEMVNAIHASLVAHQAACNAGVLHRDISVGNIMIVDDDEPNIKGGMLIDWDLSKVIDPPGGCTTTRQYTRTGTWQFMAADLVQESSIPHTFVHDLESAFWVMIWIVISYTPSSWTNGERSGFLKETMSPRVYNDSGGRSKLFFMQTEDPIPDFKLEQNPILLDLLVNLKKTLAIRHRQPPSEPSRFDLDPLAIKAETDGSGTPELPVTLGNKLGEYHALMACLKDHKIILNMIRKALNTPGWPDSDAADPQPLSTSQDVRSSSKRSRLVAEGNGVFGPLPPGKRSGSA